MKDSLSSPPNEASSLVTVLASFWCSLFPFKEGVLSFTRKKPHDIVEGRNEPLQEWEVSYIWKKKLLSNKSRTE
ncbi:hypothetical protein B5H46_17235 [Listeria monocytogenes]|nr:hypothetical protein [Listeria monocytogenes]EAC5366824.1 hypothetical protein [Listeria monocytogenes]EAC9500546.1 hypothetical protein [Listeria monocytogenes]